MANTSSGLSTKQKPSFRYDLETTAISEGGNRYVDVSDPGGKAFRFYEVEYAVACGMDGSRNIPEIVRWAKNELDLQTDVSEVKAIVEKLAELKYLEFAEAVSSSPAVTPVKTTATPKPAVIDLPKPPEIAGPDLADISTADIPKRISSRAGDGGFGEDATVAGDSIAAIAQSYTGDLATPILGEPGGSTVESAKAPVEEFELGLPGSTESMQEAKPAIPAPADLELGTPGGDAFIKKQDDKKSIVNDSFELGHAGNISESNIQASSAQVPSVQASPAEVKPPKPAEENIFEPMDEAPESSEFSSEDEFAIPMGQERTEESTPEIRISKTTDAVEDIDTTVTELEISDMDTSGFGEEELSTDLSSSFDVDAGQVKDAVRASQVMAVAELPDDLKEAAENISSPKSKSVLEVEPIPSDFTDDSFVEERTETGAKAIILPESPEKLAKKKVAAEIAAKAASKKKAPSIVVQSASLLLWLLLLAVVAFAAYYFYSNFVKEDSQASSTKTLRLPGAKQAESLVIPPATTPKSVWKNQEAPTVEITTDKNGVVAWIIEEGTAVEAGEALLKLSGYERVLKSRERNEKSKQNYMIQLQAAKAKGKAARVTMMERNVARKTADIAKDDERLQKFIVLSTVAGKAKVTSKLHSRVKSGDVLGSIEGKSSAQVEFKLFVESKAKVGDTMEVQVINPDGKQKVECQVREIEGKRLVLSCPNDSEILNETEVELIL